MSSLQRSSGRGVVVGVLGGLVEQLASVVATSVTAHVLLPRELGLVATANLVVTLLSVTTALGLGVSVIRALEIDQAMLSTIFWVSQGIAVVLGAGCTLLAGPLSHLLGNRDAAPFLMALGVLFVVRNLAVVPRSLLIRRQRFRQVYVTEAVGSVALAVVQVTTVLLGAGAWCFVYGQATLALIVVGSLGVLAAWKPSMVVRKAAVVEHGRFGAGMWANALVDYTNKNADNLAVSRFLGTGPLGLYYVAFVLPNILRQRITWVTAEIGTRAFASIQDDLVRTRRAYQMFVRCQVAFGVPVMVGLASLSAPIIHLFFGPNWSGAASPMAIVALAAAVEFSTKPSSTILIAHGHAFLPARVQLVRLAALVPGVVLGAAYGGLDGVASAVVVSAVVAGVFAQWMVRRRLGIPLGETLLSIVRAGVPSVPLAVVTVLLSRELVPAIGELATVAVCVPVGVLVYVASFWLLDRRTFGEMVGLLRKLVARESPADALT